MNDVSISKKIALDALAKAMPQMTTPDGSGQFDHDIYIADEAFVDAMQIINDLPSVESEIIRCRDCKHFSWNQKINPCIDGCLAFGKWYGEDEMGLNDYCSRAERKEE